MRRRSMRCLGNRKAIRCTLVVVGVLVAAWCLSLLVEEAVLWSQRAPQDLSTFRRNRSLPYYLDNINLLIEPPSPCEQLQVPVVILVTSTVSHARHRDVIRNTWGKHQQTYFFLGVGAGDDQLADTYREAKQHSDLVVHDLHDHYQNLTLKVGLMMQWTLNRCSHAQYMLKTDDDVMINPWTLKAVLKENKDAALLGYRRENYTPQRNEYDKWCLPRWLYPDNIIPEYLSGEAYIINGKYLKDIFEAALRVPMVNLEDTYFTSLVAKRTLGLFLTHDRRLSPYKPWVPVGCGYWGLASIHSMTPDEVVRIWPEVEELGRTSEVSSVCGGMLKLLSSNLFLYYKSRRSSN